LDNPAASADDEMSSVTIKITHNRLPQIAAKLPQLVSQIVKKAAFDIESNAKAVVPIKTGNLKNSIQAHMTGSTSAEVATGVEYAIYVEFGTRKMSARPYLTPAAEKVRSSFIQALQSLESML
jgi:HK97 gp10 family phage protein